LRAEGVARSAQQIPTAVKLDFLDPEPLFFLSSSSSLILTKTECTQFHSHYFSKNLVVPGIEPGISGSVAKKSDHSLLSKLMNKLVN
jgi:hypothetical protein